jgi:hypothetical protein
MTTSTTVIIFIVKIEGHTLSWKIQLHYVSILKNINLMFLPLLVLVQTNIGLASLANFSLFIF